MAYRKKISVNMWSPSSIENAIKELEKEEAEIKKLQAKFLSNLANKVRTFLAGKYVGKDVEVNADSDSNSVMVMAEGNGLLFIEFGTGTPADESQGIRFGYGAGSWSADHAGTYQDWLDSGGVRFSRDGHYMYDNTGLDAFMSLEMELRKLIKESMNEVFK